MMAHAGMPKPLVAQTLHLYTNMQRGMKRDKALGTPFTAYNGFGEGDVLSMFPALLLVSWQFKMIECHQRRVHKRPEFS